MKNDDMQRMGVTPWLGDTRPKNKGGRKAEKSLTAAVKAAEAARDEAKELRDKCRGFSADCGVALEVVDFLHSRMRRDLVRLAWFVGVLSALNVGVAVWAILGS